MQRIDAIKHDFGKDFSAAFKTKIGTGTKTRSKEVSQSDAHLVSMIEQVCDANGFYMHEGSETPGGESQLEQSYELD